MTKKYIFSITSQFAFIKKYYNHTVLIVTLMQHTQALKRSHR